MCVQRDSRPVAFMMFIFFNDTATTEIYTLSLHDALPIWADPVDGRAAAAGRAGRVRAGQGAGVHRRALPGRRPRAVGRDRKSTRLNSSHANISYAVFCLKKKTKIMAYIT